MLNGTVNGVLRYTWKLIILVVGATIMLLGIVLIFTPGPAFIVIPIGLAILATEFAWARHLLRQVKGKVRQAGQKLGLGQDSGEQV
jgi:uncharacterized protein (TIGR02611 family)